MEMRGDGVYIRDFHPSDAGSALELWLRNREFFRPYFPRHADYFFTLDGQRDEIERNAADWSNDAGYVFGVFAVGDDALIGGVSLRNVARGAWQNATLGYYIGEHASGRGLATEAVRLALGFAFEHARLHRVQAATLVSNQASMRVLEKNGFDFEGVAKRYLQINGVWEDHNMFAITVESWKAASRVPQ